MKIAYVTIHVAPELMQGGVGRKIKSQTRIWRERGNEVTIFSLSSAQIPFPNERQFIFKANANLFKRELNRVSTLKDMIASIQDYKPDLIYLRYGLYSYPLQHIFKIAPVVLEVNANDVDEYRSRGLFFYWFNRLTRNITFSLSTGLILMTQEMANMNARYKKRASVVSNGIDLEAYQPMPAPNNKTPVLTMLGSPGMIWHGMDKLFPLARKFPDLTINIIGYSRDDFSEDTPSNIHAHGYLQQDALNKILSTTDVVFGTLALHRKNMQELPPLKVREALAFGIPVIVAYKDTDLDGIILDSILRIPNTEDNVIENAEKIREFAYAMMGRRIDIKTVAPYFDQKQKESARLSFFQDILQAPHTKK